MNNLNKLSNQAKLFFATLVIYIGYLILSNVVAFISLFIPSFITAMILSIFAGIYFIYLKDDIIKALTDGK